MNGIVNFGAISPSTELFMLISNRHVGDRIPKC